MVLDLFGQDRRVRLAPAEPVEGIGDQHVDRAGAEAFAQRRQSRAFAVLGAGVNIGEHVHKYIAALGTEGATAGLLGR